MKLFNGYVKNEQGTQLVCQARSKVWAAHLLGEHIALQYLARDKKFISVWIEET